MIMFQRLVLLSSLLLLLELSHVAAFSVLVPSRSMVASSVRMANCWDGAGSASGGSAGAGGAIEQIEFKIHADGRVEETVRGVKGGNCHKVTEKINECLGQVVATSPTEEMFEQEVVVSETLYQTMDSSLSDWEGGSTW
jgi:Protein of unknown function (DUF2997)